jgi:hypothetical protein
MKIYRHVSEYLALLFSSEGFRKISSTISKFIILLLIFILEIYTFNVTYNIMQKVDCSRDSVLINKRRWLDA